MASFGSYMPFYVRHTVYDRLCSQISVRPPRGIYYCRYPTQLRDAPCPHTRLSCRWISHQPGFWESSFATLDGCHVDIDLSKLLAGASWGSGTVISLSITALFTPYGIWFVILMPYIKIFVCDGSKADGIEVRISLLTLGKYV